MVRPTVIFDLGGVLVSVDFMRACARLEAAGGLASARIRDLIVNGREKAEFDCGRLSPREFAARVCAAVGASLTYSEFADIWCDIFSEQREVTGLLDQIGQRADLILLSNTDPLHLERVGSQFDFLGKFGHLVLSYEIRHTKPARQIYERALALCPPGGKAIFFDDVPEFVAAARACGLPAEQFVSVDTLKRDLVQFGVL